MLRPRFGRVAALVAALAAFACRDEAVPAPVAAAPSASSPIVTGGPEPVRLILYPNAPATKWGAAEFFDPDRSRPATRVAHGPVTTTEGLAPEVIERVMRDKENELLYCYWASLKDNPGLKGRVVLSASVGADGKVKSAVDKGSDLGRASLVSCIVKTLEAGELEFPPSGQAGSFVYTLTFSPG